MSTWIRILGAVGLPLVLGAVAATAQQGGTPSPPAAFSPCSDCHDTEAAAFLANPHARAAVAAGETSKAVCESCHGNGEKHAAEGEAALISVPKGAPGAKTCLNCHEGRNDTSPSAAGAHTQASVYCGDCHSIHGGSTPPPALLARPVGELCVSCHSSQRNQFHKPYAHRLGAGGMECTSCHNAHGGTGRSSLRATRAGELPCLSCHAEKQGPFVFEHVNGVTADCMACHEPHGSVNPKRLIRARVDQLCLECHTTLPAGNLGSQPPSFHDLRSPRYTNCTSCHVAIHGSNSSPLLLK